MPWCAHITAAGTPWFAFSYSAMTETTRGFVTAGIIVAVAMIAGFVIDRILVAAFRRLANATPGKIDDVIVDSVKGIARWTVILIGVYYALPFLPLPERIDEEVTIGFRIAVLVLAIVVTSRFASGIAAHYAHRLVPSSVSLAKIFVNVVVLVIGLLVVFQTMGIEIAPMIAALGVGGLAVALALQDTLANFFAGIQILASKQTRPGDYVRLDSGQEGVILDISWRTTTLRMLRNNVVIIPNTKFAQSIVTNFTVPEGEVGMAVTLGVAYGSDLAKVERVAIETAREVASRVDGAVKQFAPMVRFHTFAESSITFDLILRTREFVDQGLLKHELIKAIQQRFAAESIEIPFPIRTVHVRERS